MRDKLCVCVCVVCKSLCGGVVAIIWYYLCALPRLDPRGPRQWVVTRLRDKDPNSDSLWVLLKPRVPNCSRHDQHPTRLRNDLHCAGWGVKLYSLTLQHPIPR